MTHTIDAILRDGDIDALQAYVDNLEARNASMAPAPATWYWPGPPSAALGGLLATTIMRTQGHTTTGDALAFVLDRLRDQTYPNHAQETVYKALMLHVQDHPATITTAHAKDLFEALRATHHNGAAARFRRRGLFASYADLYALVRATLPPEDALAELSSSVAQHDFSIDDIALMLLLYGKPIFAGLLPVVRHGAHAGVWAFLTPEERRLVNLLVSGTAHQHIPLLASVDLDAYHGAPAGELVAHMIAQI